MCGFCILMPIYLHVYIYVEGLKNIMYGCVFLCIHTYVSVRVDIIMSRG